MSVLSARVRRASVAAASLAMIATAYAAPSAAAKPAAAPLDSPRAKAAATWLGGELTKGRIHNGQFDFDDWGLTIDTAFALAAVDRRDPKIDRIAKALKANYESYVSFGGDQFAGSWGKLLLATKVLREKARNYGGVNVRASVLDLLAPSTEGFEAGRARDTGASDFSNSIGQSYVVLGLARTGGVPQDAVDYLLKQQCADGFFRIQLVAGETCNTTGSEPDIDATALAMQALDVAEENGADVPIKKINKAGRWLVSVQGGNGAFGGGGVSDFGPNTNSTGLAAASLALVGGNKPEADARRWLGGMQLTKGRVDSGPGRKDVGAIAYNLKARNAAVRNGVTKDTRDEFRRATPQAIWGLKAVWLGDLTSR